jgi:hypothetical protein
MDSDRKESPMLIEKVTALGTINKAWAAAIAAPLADWLIDLLADAMWNGPRIAMPESAAMALSALIVGLVVYHVPNLPVGEA